MAHVETSCLVSQHAQFGHFNAGSTVRFAGHIQPFDVIAIGQRYIVDVLVIGAAPLVVGLPAL